MNDKHRTFSEIPLSDSSRRYRHVQIGYVTSAAMSFGLLIVGMGIVRSLTLDDPGLPRTVSVALLGTVALFLIVGLVVFSTLTIDVSDDALTWYFTGHVLGGAVPIREIERVASVKNLPAYGWGIRALADGRQYNVSGLKAVSITLRDGRHFVLGSDEPDRLAQAIEPGVR